MTIDPESTVDLERQLVDTLRELAEEYDALADLEGVTEGSVTEVAAGDAQSGFGDRVIVDVVRGGEATDASRSQQGLP